MVTSASTKPGRGEDVLEVVEAVVADEARCVRRLSSRTCWKASENVHRIGSTTIVNDDDDGGGDEQVAGRAGPRGPGRTGPAGACGALALGCRRSPPSPAAGPVGPLTVTASPARPVIASAACFAASSAGSVPLATSLTALATGCSPWMAPSRSPCPCGMAQRASWSGARGQRVDDVGAVEVRQRRLGVHADVHLRPGVGELRRVVGVAGAHRHLALRCDRDPGLVAVAHHVLDELLGRFGGRVGGDRPTR